MIKPRRIGHATFETPDLQKMIDYYTNVMGLVLAEREKDRAFLTTQIGLLAIQLNKGDLILVVGMTFWAAYTIFLRMKPPELSGLSFLVSCASVGVVLLVILQTLSPAERLAFVLRGDCTDRGPYGEHRRAARGARPSARTR